MQDYRADFPALAQQVHNKPLVYLDSGATSLKPKPVIEAVERFYAMENASVHRGVHALSAAATMRFEGVRSQVGEWVNAQRCEEVIFVKGATEGINLVASSFGPQVVGQGDVILLTEMEHHANIVPWQQLADRVGAEIKAIPVLDNGELDMVAAEQLITAQVKILSVMHVSNVLGTINPIKKLTKLAHQHGVKVVVDGAQAAPHMAIDVQQLDCDFYVFSGHKMYAPTGIGVLYGKYDLLAAMPPYQTGGSMITEVAIEASQYQDPPMRFEPGTPHAAGVIGLGAAIDYINQLGFAAIQAHEAALYQAARSRMEALPGLTIYGDAAQRAAVIAFTLDCAHPHDICTIADQYGVAMRGGHHCAMPLMQRFGVPATARASFGVYNHLADIDVLIAALQAVIDTFAGGA